MRIAGGIVCILIALVLTPFAYSAIFNSPQQGADWVAHATGAILPALAAWVAGIVLLARKSK